MASASGGSINYVSGRKIHIFRSSGTLNITEGGNFDVLIVAGGGGGGGGYQGGGGGAGGVIQKTLTLAAGAYPVTVGAGGAGSNGSNSYISTSGSNSSFGGETAIDGGAGAYEIIGERRAGRVGGSGGGGSHPYDILSGAAGSPGQGNGGGDGLTGSIYVGGGGGGAGTAGGNATASAAGKGGAGITSNISGTSTNYAGGGGGSHRSGTSNGTATHGGGAGGNPGAAGAANTGGGGGAGQTGINDTGVGGNGGSGIIIISYVYTATSPEPIGGSIYDLGNYKVAKFTNNGQLWVGTPIIADILVVGPTEISGTAPRPNRCGSVSANRRLPARRTPRRIPRGCPARPPRPYRAQASNRPISR